MQGVPGSNGRKATFSNESVHWITEVHVQSLVVEARVPAQPLRWDPPKALVSMFVVMQAVLLVPEFVVTSSRSTFRVKEELPD